MSRDLKVLRALSALLTYPRQELLDALPEVQEVLHASSLLSSAEKSKLQGLIAELAHGDLLELEERYVALFDRGRSTSLHLFEHLHGESRDRGSAMADLAQIYAAAGLELAPGELPDYLPALLEYLSCRSLEEARAMLADCAHIVRRIGDALASRGSRYAAVAAAILALAGEKGLDESKAAAPPDEPPLDEAWAEAPAFGPDGADSPHGTTQAVIRFIPREAAKENP
ncbi:MAG TPA: nitrate reductase molybdenum cofactor assembly chaperone [Burkholderiales bacterium]